MRYHWARQIAATGERGTAYVAVFRNKRAGWQRGLYRLWVVLAGLWWVFFAGLVIWLSMRHGMAATWQFMAAKHGVPKLIMVIFLPPIAVLLFLEAIAWVARGFYESEEAQPAPLPPDPNPAPDANP